MKRVIHPPNIEATEQALKDLLVINAGLGLCTPEEGYDRLSWAISDLKRAVKERSTSLASENAALKAENERLKSSLQGVVDCYGVGWKASDEFVEELCPLIMDAQALLSSPAGHQEGGDDA